MRVGEESLQKLSRKPPKKNNQLHKPAPKKTRKCADKWAAFRLLMGGKNTPGVIKKQQDWKTAL